MKLNEQNFYITESKEESIQMVNEHLEDFGIPPLTGKQLKNWPFKGGDTLEQLREWADEYIDQL
jgi:hypothetical protein